MTPITPNLPEMLAEARQLMALARAQCQQPAEWPDSNLRLTRRSLLTLAHEIVPFSRRTARKCRELAVELEKAIVS